MANNDTIKKTFLVAILLCVCCSVLVSTAAVALKDRQEHNKKLDMKKKVLEAAGLWDPKSSSGKVDFDALYAGVEERIVDLSTGDYVTDADLETFDAKSEAKDPATSVEIERERDFGAIKRRGNRAKVYLVKSGEQLSKVLLPVYGKGLWGTMYGFFALDADLATVSALVFYEHIETPGLGGEVENPRWKALWKGKRVRDDEGAYQLRVIKGTAKAGSEHEIDGLSGATITSRGVTNLLKFWLGEDGFGPFLTKLKGA